MLIETPASDARKLKTIFRAAQDGTELVKPRGTRKKTDKIAAIRITGVTPNLFIRMGAITIALIAPRGAKLRMTPQVAKETLSLSMYSGTQATEDNTMCPSKK